MTRTLPIIRQALSADIPLVDAVLHHPEVYPYTYYDGKTPREELTCAPFVHAGPPYYTLIDDRNQCVAMLSPENSILWVAHDNVLPEARGRRGVRALKAMIQWMWDNTPCRKIIGYTPVDNKRAWVFAQMIGLSIEGKLHNAILINGTLQDMYVSGVCKGGESHVG